MGIDPATSVAILGLICLVAAWADIRSRRLPNWLVLVTVVAGLLSTVRSIHDPALSSHLLHVGAALVGGFALFAIGLFGGGDAKFYAALAAWFPLRNGGDLALSVSLTGLALVVVWFFWRRLKGAPLQIRATEDMAKFPYGVAIAAGAALLYTRHVPEVWNLVA